MQYIEFSIQILFSTFSFSFLFQDLFLERRREGEREGEKHQSVVASCVPSTGDLARNPGVCPDWESNWQPFGLQVDTQSTEPHQPGLFSTVSKPIHLEMFSMFPLHNCIVQLYHTLFDHFSIGDYSVVCNLV